MSKSQFKIPRRELRFPPAIRPEQILKHACLWCKRGDLTWDAQFDEWVCAQCGWREFELTRYQREKLNQTIPISVGGTKGLTGLERLPIGVVT